MNNKQQPAQQDLRSLTEMLFDELDGMVERLPKEANWFGNVDHIKQNINLLKKEFKHAAEVSAEDKNRIAELGAEIETLKYSETLHNEYMKGFGAGYDEGFYDGLNR